MIEKIQVKWLKNSQTLRQAYSCGLEYAFLSSDNKQVTPLAYCKDYLQDALMGLHNNQKVGPIFGFTYDPKSDIPICLSQTKLIICNSSDKNFSDKIPQMLQFLHSIEKKLKLIKTSICEIENPPHKKYTSAFALTGSSRWELSPPMISLYTLLIRVGFCHKIDDSYETTMNNIINGNIAVYQSSDLYLLKSAKPAIDKIIKFGYAKIFHKNPVKNFPLVETDQMHSHYGIVGYTSGTPKMTYWHRNLKTKKIKPIIKKEEGAAQ